MSNGLDHVEAVYKRLADFFTSKGDAPLSSTEVSVCLEWLGEVSQSNDVMAPTFATARRQPAISFATPAPPTSRRLNRVTSTSSVKKMLPQISTPKADMTPAKKQIQELLSKTKPAELDPPNTPPRQVIVKPPVIVTRTAKAILDILDNPKIRSEPSTDKNINTFHLKLPSQSDFNVDKPREPIIINDKSEPPCSENLGFGNGEEIELPTYKFDLGKDDFGIEAQLDLKSNQSLPNYTFHE